MERTEATIGKAHLEGGHSASLSANIWQEMQSNSMRGASDTGSPRVNSGASAPEATSTAQVAGGLANDSTRAIDSKFEPNKMDPSADNSKPVAKDNAQNMIPEPNAAPNNLAADQGARVEKPSDNLIFTPLYQGSSSESFSKLNPSNARNR
jgi:hypothetical protein